MSTPSFSCLAAVLAVVPDYFVTRADLTKPKERQMMRERASQLNGRFEFASAPGRGTTITIVIPFR